MMETCGRADARPSPPSLTDYPRAGSHFDFGMTGIASRPLRVATNGNTAFSQVCSGAVRRFLDILKIAAGSGKTLDDLAGDRVRCLIIGVSGFHPGET